MEETRVHFMSEAEWVVRLKSFNLFAVMDIHSSKPTMHDKPIYNMYMTGQGSVKNSCSTLCIISWNYSNLLLP